MIFILPCSLMIAATFLLFLYNISASIFFAVLAYWSRIVLVSILECLLSFFNNNHFEYSCFG